MKVRGLAGFVVPVDIRALRVSSNKDGQSRGRVDGLQEIGVTHALTTALKFSVKMEQDCTYFCLLKFKLPKDSTALALYLQGTRLSIIRGKYNL